MTALDNIFWRALSGPQSRISIGTDTARRYIAGFPPLIGFADPQNPDFEALMPYCAPGELFMCEGWTGEPPHGWGIELDSMMLKMTWEKPLPAEADVVRLRPEHHAQAVELADMTKPGPFGPRTLEMGEFYGCFEGERLIAMAGERAHAPGVREISIVCTHPDHRGRGLAALPITHLIRCQMQRGEAPFLHVMSGNTTARALYDRMGFSVYAEVPVRRVLRK